MHLSVRPLKGASRHVRQDARSTVQCHKKSEIPGRINNDTVLVALLRPYHSFHPAIAWAHHPATTGCSVARGGPRMPIVLTW